MCDILITQALALYDIQMTVFHTAVLNNGYSV